MTSTVIHVAAALVVNTAGHALMVRKRGTTMFMQPGGKSEAGESPAETLLRELHEELGLVVQPSRLSWVGTFEEDAANEPGQRVRAEVFDLLVDDEQVRAAAEIAECRWVDPRDPGPIDLAPLSSRALLPLLVARSPRLGP